jgi:hypothetical protein
MKKVTATSHQAQTKGNQVRITHDIYGFAKALGESRHMNKRGMIRKYHSVYTYKNEAKYQSFLTLQRGVH